MINKLKEDLLFINKEIVTAANDGLTHRLIKTHLLGLNNILSDLIRNLQSDLKAICISCTKENENCRLHVENEQLKSDIESGVQCILCKKEMEACRLLIHNDKLKRAVSSLKPIIERLTTKDDYQSLTEVMEEFEKMKKIIEGTNV